MSEHHAFRFGVVSAQIKDGADLATRARKIESLGYSTFLLPDTLGSTPSPFSTLATVAAVTSTLRVGTYVLANDYRHPLIVAREAATLDVLSGGRFELGLGAGRAGAERDYQQLGLTFDSGGSRLRRLADALRVIKPWLSGETVTVDSGSYLLQEVSIFPQPAQKPHPPLLVAGAGKRLLSMAAQEANIIGLGIRPDEAPERAHEMVGWIRDAAGERFEEDLRRSSST